MLLVVAVLGALAILAGWSLTHPSSDVVPSFDELGPESDGVVDEADGLLPEGVTVHERDYPGVTNLRPALLAALREAGNAAAGEGIVLSVTSGWRSAEYQEQLLQEAVQEYGSRAEAARWVATPQTSAHVSGDAVDVGPYEAILWLADHGADHGLCQIYLNEPWHFELRTDAASGECPRPFTDPTEDPRLQQ